MFHEHHSRSLIKSITWFALAFVISFLILFMINHDWITSFIEAILLQAIKAIAYYFHERVWNKSNFGQRLKKPAIVLK